MYSKAYLFFLSKLNENLFFIFLLPDRCGVSRCEVPDGLVGRDMTGRRRWKF